MKKNIWKILTGFGKIGQNDENEIFAKIQNVTHEAHGIAPYFIKENAYIQYIKKIIVSTPYFLYLNGTNFCGYLFPRVLNFAGINFRGWSILDISRVLISAFGHISASFTGINFRGR